ncbi:type VI secretion system-associated protein TagF [Kangiella koreensis]|uniref:Type VI secretion-associated protein, BMA_A0400 family n=1 Tax=Kangiella koreensis (strain DSM 16069 / JCM 12317 / KCTC 12182 / SW-125) TaxID=523791 RepID=C7R9N8_KANKD|nr:type VI secretion system-associated protein TagF [Kangiella koreensis]ACV27907.1 type VI secretion-associated protein, BMA_A0400 family [Kangiella koreensis DSM 16069]
MDMCAMRLGCFGKIRNCGDFISRHMPHEIESSFTEWLEEGLAETKERFQQQWLDYFLTSPIWNFVIEEPDSEQVIVGTMMPSMDKVGRYYPLIVLQTINHDAGLNVSLLEEVETLMLSTLDKGVEQEQFVQALDLLHENSGPEKDQGQRYISFSQLRAFFTNCAQVAGDTVAKLWSEQNGLMPTEKQSINLYRHESEVNGVPSSIWWTKGSAHMGATMLLCQGLPPIAGIHATLDGDWFGAGWQPITDIENSEKNNDEKNNNGSML